MADVVSMWGQDAVELVPSCEAILFTAGKALTIEHVASALGCTLDLARQAMEQLQMHLEQSSRGMSLVWQDNTVQLAVKPQYQRVAEYTHRSDIEHAQGIVQEYLHALQLRGRRPATIKGYRQFLNRFTASVGKPVEEIQTRDVRLFLMAEEQRGNSRNSLATKTVILRSFFTWCEKEELLERNPMNRIDTPKTDPPAPKFITHEELELVREACTKPLDRCLIEVLYGSGLRVSEAIALDWSDINWTEKCIGVRDGKGGKSRIVPASTRALLLLRRLQEQRHDSDPWVFRSQFKRRMSKESVERRVGQIGERAGLHRRLTPHVMRHTVATHLLAAGVPIDVVQAMLGHSSVATTQVYARTQQSTVDSWYRKVIA